MIWVSLKCHRHLKKRIIISGTVGWKSLWAPGHSGIGVQCYFMNIMERWSILESILSKLQDPNLAEKYKMRGEPILQFPWTLPTPSPYHGFPELLAKQPNWSTITPPPAIFRPPPKETAQDTLVWAQHRGGWEQSLPSWSILAPTCLPETRQCCILGRIRHSVREGAALSLMAKTKRRVARV